MSTKRKAAVIVLLVTAVITAASVFVCRADPGQANEKIPVYKSTSPIYYTVQQGDCLWSVAEEFNVDVDLLAYANDIKSDDILPEGIELVIPEGNKIHYTVDRGDTLWGIAKKFNTTVESLVYENGTGVLKTLLPERTLVVTVKTGDFTGEDTETVIWELLPGIEWPVQGRVSSVFGRRWGRMHKGIDIAADYGKAIRAVEDGTVVFAGDRGTYGNTVILNHGGGFRSLYAHASKLEVVSGQRVNKGEIIARIGSSGRSTGPHLHLELLFEGKPVDPEDYLPDNM